MMYQNPYTRIFALTLVAVILFAPVVSAQQVEDEIISIFERRDRKIKDLLGTGGEISAAHKEELRSVINEMIDFGAMGEAALGPHWAPLTETQQSEFVRLFGDIVRHQSLADLDVYRARVTYDSVTIDSGNTRVTSTTIYRDVPTTVEYDMIYSGSQWLVWDIILDDVSTVGGYSRSFQSVIRKKGFESLMRSLNKRLDRIRKS